MMGIEIFLVAMGAILLMLLGMGIANQRTLKQRLEIIDEAYSYPPNKEKIKKLSEVSYDKHLWYNITLRDPKKLYN